jgi:preprotein translocase subunit SecD
MGMNRNTFFAVFSLLSLTLSLFGACATRQEAAVACPAIEMRAVADTKTNSTRAVTVDDTTTIITSRTPLVSTGDITSASASRSGGEWILHFDLTEEAAKRLHDYTAQHVGDKLALLVDGKVRGAPRIAGAITGGYQIDGLDRTDAERMANTINAGCHR